MLPVRAYTTARVSTSSTCSSAHARPDIAARSVNFRSTTARARRGRVSTAPAACRECGRTTTRAAARRDSRDFAVTSSWIRARRSRAPMPARASVPADTTTAVSARPASAANDASRLTARRDTVATEGLADAS